MSRPSLKEIKEISIRDRYYPYDTWIDSIFSPISPYLAWLFIRLNISGNGVSWISGFLAIIGAILMATESSILIFIGSFGYMLFYQLDYVDGAVARLNKKTGVGGQYIDFIMHVISHVAIISGLALGAISTYGSTIYPLAILALVASGLSHARHSTAWFAIVMEQQKSNKHSFSSFEAVKGKKQRGGRRRKRSLRKVEEGRRKMSSLIP